MLARLDAMDGDEARRHLGEACAAIQALEEKVDKVAAAFASLAASFTQASSAVASLAT